MCAKITLMKPRGIETKVNISKNDIPIITSGETSKIEFNDSTKVRCLFDLILKIVKAPKTPIIVEINELIKATKNTTAKIC